VGDFSSGKKALVLGAGYVSAPVIEYLTRDPDLGVTVAAAIKVPTREMENISRDPTFGDFVTIRTEASMQDVTVASLQSTRVRTLLDPPLLNVMYCVRVSLCTVKIFLEQH
jgi:hypothetical protein